MKTEKTEVIFRKFKDGSIIALFPYEVESRYFTCLSYIHLGQHSTASLDLILLTKLATPEEYKNLFNELTNQVGYNLLIKKKANHKKYNKIYYYRNRT